MEYVHTVFRTADLQFFQLFLCYYLGAQITLYDQMFFIPPSFLADAASVWSQRYLHLHTVASTCLWLVTVWKLLLNCNWNSGGPYFGRISTKIV